jgi:hypothetical protein
MRRAHQYVSALFLAAILAASGSIVAAATPQEASVQVRVYDSNHHDYHNWDDREDHAYRGYLTERHEDYRPYDKQNRRHRKNYWNWRHSHPDHDEHVCWRKELIVTELARRCTSGVTLLPARCELSEVRV